MRRQYWNNLKKNKNKSRKSKNLKDLNMHKPMNGGGMEESAL